MLTVVLADDDFLAREVLIDYIKWDTLGMEVIGVAENGKNALELCVTLQPDIFVTDIKMPFMSGLEVAMNLQEKHIHSKIILISGIQDFDYAKTALDVLAAAYILKPIQLIEVTAALKKVKKAIELERNRNEILINMQKKLSDNIPLAKDNFLHNLIMGIYGNSIEIYEKIRYFSLPLQPEEEISVVVAEIDDYRTIKETKEEEDMQFFNFSIKNIIEQILLDYRCGVCCNTQDNQFVLLLNKNGTNEQKMELVFESISELLSKFEKITISFGIGSVVQSIMSINSSYQEALHALGYKFFTGNQSIIHIHDISGELSRTPATSNVSLPLASLSQKIIEQIRIGQSTNLAVQLKEYSEIFRDSKNFSKDYIRGRFLELVIHVYLDFSETEGMIHSIFTSYTNAVEDIIHATIVSDIEENTKKILFAITDYYNQKYSSRHRSLVKRIKDYIQRNCTKNISLTDIANSVYMSPNYICGVFKKETGETINEYLIITKMNHAKKMLKNTELKIFEVAEKLGYETSNYFSYAFKRHTGKTPQQYRTEELVKRD